MYSCKNAARSLQLYRATVAASVVCFAASLALCLLSILEQLRTIRPSTLILVFVFPTILFDSAYVRTLWLTGDNTAPLATALVVVKCFVLLLEARNKRSSLSPGLSTFNKEELSGIFSKSLFLWLFELLRLGYSKVLVLDDLYPLPGELLSNTLTTNFERAWKWDKRRLSATATKDDKQARNSPVTKENKPSSLFLALVWSLKWHVVFPIFPRLCQIAFTFSQPFLLIRVLAFLSDNSSPASIGYGLIGAYAIVYSGIAVCLALLPA